MRQPVEHDTPSHPLFFSIQPSATVGIVGIGSGRGVEDVAGQVTVRSVLQVPVGCWMARVGVPAHESPSYEKVSATPLPQRVRCDRAVGCDRLTVGTHALARVAIVAQLVLQSPLQIFSVVNPSGMEGTVGASGSKAEQNICALPAHVMDCVAVCLRTAIKLSSVQVALE